MTTEVEQVNEKTNVKQYKVQYPISDYTFPEEARINSVEINDEILYVELTDGRTLSIPLWWIPTVYNASPGEREKYEINQNRTMLIWDPEKCDINDELRINDYLGPVREMKA